MEDFYYRIDYKFTSPLGYLEGSRYVTSILGDIIQEDEDGQNVAMVGRITLQFVLVSLAINNEYDLYEIFDESAPLFEIGQAIFDFQYGEIKDKIQDYYNGEIVNSDIYVIERIEILPPYRGNNLGKKIIKDIYNRFSGACGLFVLKSFPLQFETEGTGNSEWNKQMKLDAFEKNEKMAVQKLKSFYKSCGFETIPGISSNFMFVNPLKRNSKMDKIELE
jgi:GNAT superfamily N-acetyltransferase